MLDYFIFEMLIPTTVKTLNFKPSVMLKNKQRQFNNLQKKFYKNNHLTSYMFRPSRGHLQADT
jgi:hypothetical protein